MNYMIFIMTIHLAPEKVKVTEKMLSNYCKKIADKYNISTGLSTQTNTNIKQKRKVCFTL